MNRPHAHLRAPGPCRVLLLGLLLALVLPLPLTACTVTDTGPASAGSPAAGLRDPASGATAAVHVYFYSAQGLERVSRPYRGPDAPGAALRQLASGPDAAERARGLISYAPHDAPVPVVTGHGPGTVQVFAPQGWESRSALRQLVCTAADAVSIAAGTGVRELQVQVHRGAGRDAVTKVCTP